ncbi:hypothetical protein GGR32_000180 [Mesonia hippocampi]|uniref:Outer membrane protein beta-barrel domain-containing protein n=2 Tax=Mesonia hippocampi TaxID=1628250 RepID=A0A840EIB9_9FLAO|nr:hypothetical protein [Mesonia hippocampi]
MMVLFLWINTSYTQTLTFSITGKVVDEQQQALESATVFAETVKDSSLVGYTITNASGDFELTEKMQTPEEIYLYISYTGFVTHKQKLIPKPTISLGEIPLKIENNTLDEVLVEGKSAPIAIKKDTLEFNAASFATRPDANLEELLKKLPGIEVDNDGNIMVNGKQVSRILVNGQEFFGKDPKIATKNLPKDIINKIQVVDTKTKKEEFTGKESDAEDKTINITIAEDKNKGFFARMTAGGGTNNRYELNGTANYFNNKMRLSLLGSGNNINSSGFTFDEVFDSMGRNAYSVTGGGSNSGITKTENTGVDFVNEWDNKTELSASYFYNKAANTTASIGYRENILPDKHYFNENKTTSKRNNQNHRASIGFHAEPDTLTRISIYPNLTANTGFSTNTSKAFSYNANGDPINDAETSTFSEVKNINFSNTLNAIRKIGKNGAYVALEFSNTNNNSKQQEEYYAERKIYKETETLPETSIQDQYIEENKQTDKYSVMLDTRIPITEKSSIDINYTYVKENQANERLVYEKDQAAHYNALNENLSNNFQTTIYKYQPSLGWVYKTEKLITKVSSGLQQTKLSNEDYFSDKRFSNTYNNLYARIFARYKITKTKSLRFTYRNSRSTPSIQQLQPVANVTNPLNTVVGNPDLNPTLSHRMRLNYYDYNFKAQTGFYAYINGSVVNDKIVSVSITDENLIRTTTYANVNGSWRVTMGVNGDKKYDWVNGDALKISIGVTGNYSNNIGFSNGKKYTAKRFTTSPRVSVTYDVGEIISITPNYSIDFNNSRYSLNNNRNEQYINQALGLNITSYFPENLVFGSDMRYTKLGNVAPGFKDNFLLWNVSLGYKFWGEDGIIKLKVFDMLNENTSTSRYTGQDYVQDTEQLVLEQYIMLSFTYKFNKFAGSKTSPPSKRNRRYRIR